MVISYDQLQECTNKAEALEAERDRLELSNSNLNGGIDELIAERDTLKEQVERTRRLRNDDADSDHVP